MTVTTAFDVSPPIDDAEIQSYVAIARWAFNMPPVEEYNWISREVSDRIRVIRHDKKIVGGLTLLPVGQWFGGCSVPMTGIRAVCVAPEARSTGAATVLMRAALDEIHAAGVPLSALYPATQPVYRRQGYEQAGSRITYEMPVGTIDSRDRELDVQPIADADRSLLRDVYTERARRTTGNIDRDDWFWSRKFDVWKKDVHGYTAVGADGIEGYILLTDKTEPHDLADLVAQDWVILSARAGQRLLSLVADHRSMIRTIRWQGALSDPLWLLPREQKIKTIERFDWMLRIVDVAAALKTRGYPPDLRTTLPITVRDDIYAHNNRSFDIEVAEGRASVRECKLAETTIDIRGFAAIYSGHLSPGELLATDYIDGPPADLARLGQLFAGPPPWMPDMF